MRRFSGFEFRHSNFDFILASWRDDGAPDPDSDGELNYMPYMAYMVEKAAFPSVFSLQPIFFTMKGMKNMKVKSV